MDCGCRRVKKVLSKKTYIASMFVVGSPNWYSDLERRKKIAREGIREDSPRKTRELARNLLLSGALNKAVGGVDEKMCLGRGLV